MKDYSLNYEDSKRFILSYKVENENIVAKLASGEKYVVPYNQEKEDANVKAQQENEKMRHQIVSSVHFNIYDSRFKQTLTDYEQDFIDKLSVCQLFEKLALLNTMDINITKEMPPKGFQLLKDNKHIK